MPGTACSNVGSGRMEILEASVPSKIVIKLRFLQAVRRSQHRRVHNTAAGRCRLSPTWTMSWARAVFMSRLMQVFINLDHMIGRDFEVGLANLKKLTEK